MAGADFILAQMTDRGENIAYSKSWTGEPAWAAMTVRQLACCYMVILHLGAKNDESGTIWESGVDWEIMQGYTTGLLPALEAKLVPLYGNNNYGAVGRLLADWKDIGGNDGPDGYSANDYLTFNFSRMSVEAVRATLSFVYWLYSLMDSQGLVSDDILYPCGHYVSHELYAAIVLAAQQRLPSGS
jgi:hypothetical protein